MSAWADRVRSNTARALEESGKPMREVAQALYMDPRTLRRRLQPGGRLTVDDVWRVAELLGLGLEGHVALYEG